MKASLNHEPQGNPCSICGKFLTHHFVTHAMFGTPCQHVYEDGRRCTLKRYQHKARSILYPWPKSDRRSQNRSHVIAIKKTMAFSGRFVPQFTVCELLENFTSAIYRRQEWVRVIAKGQVTSIKLSDVCVLVPQDVDKNVGACTSP